MARITYMLIFRVSYVMKQEPSMKSYAQIKILLAILALFPGPSPRPAIASSPKFVLGPEVLVSTNPDGGDLRCEPSAAIFKDTIVVAWNDSHGGRNGSSTGTAVGWSISKDRGKTFQFGGYLPPAGNDFACAGADSRVAADQDGNFYLEILSWQKSSHIIQCYAMERKSPGRWRKLPDAVIRDQAKGDGADKPAMCVSGRRIGIVYTDMRRASGATISFVLSHDGGDTWSKPIPVSANSAKVRTGSSVIIKENEIVVAWTEGDSANASEIWFSISQDGGRSFSAAALAYRLRRPFVPPNAYRMALGQMAGISNDTALAFVNGPSGRFGCHLSFLEGTDTGSDVLSISYDARAQKWSEPIVLKGYAGAIKIFSSMAVAGGNLAFLNYGRAGGDSTVTDVYLSLISEGERLEVTKLNTASSDWAATQGDEKYAPIQRIYGDYITLASDGKNLVAAWTDGRTGVPRIYARVIEFQ